MLAHALHNGQLQRLSGAHVTRMPDGRYAICGDQIDDAFSCFVPGSNSVSTLYSTFRLPRWSPKRLFNPTLSLTPPIESP